jgi:hypothetical protein
MYVINKRNDQHDDIVKMYAGQFAREGYKVYADIPGYGQPTKVGRHLPDISAYWNGQKTTLVEVKIGNDIYSDRTKEQLTDFSANPSITFFFVVERINQVTAQNIMAEVGVDQKPNVKLIVL